MYKSHSFLYKTLLGSTYPIYDPECDVLPYGSTYYVKTVFLLRVKE